MTKVTEITRSTLIPVRRAMIRSCWVARIALPILVYLINRVRPIMAVVLVTRITSSAEPMI